MSSRSRRAEQRSHENICGKFLHNAIASTSNSTHSNSRTIVLRVPLTMAGTEICFGCWRDRPVLDRTHLVVDEVVPMGSQEATRPDSDEDCIRIGEFPCYSHYAERLARPQQIPIFKVLIQPCAELRPTEHEASALTTRPDVRYIKYKL